MPANYPYLFFASANAVTDGMNGSNFKNADVDAALEDRQRGVRSGDARRGAEEGVPDRQRGRRGRADLLAGLGDGDQQQVQAHRLQRLLVQRPLGDPRLRPEVACVDGPRRRTAARLLPNNSMVSDGMDKLALAVDRLDRLNFPSDISFEPEGEALAAAIRPATREAARELPEPHLALHARRLGEPDHARPERRLLAALLAGRRPARLHLRPHDQGQGRSLHPRRRRGEAARRYSGHGRGLALDERRRGDRRARRRSRARRRRYERRQAAVLGRRRRPGGRQSEGRAAAALQGRCGERRDDWRSARPISASGSSTCSATDAAVALVSDDPSERGWYHTRLVRLDFASRASHGPASNRDWQLLSPSASPSGKQRRLPRRLVERPRPGRERDPRARYRDRQGVDASPPPRRPTSRPSSGATTRASGSPAGRSSARSTAWSRPTEQFSGRATRTPSSARTAFPRRSRRRPTRPASPRCARLSASRRRSCSSQRVRRGLEAGHQAERRDRRREFNDYPEVRPLRWQGADGLELDGLVLLPRDREPGPLPTIVDIHGGPSWAAKYAFNPGYALPFAAAGYAVFLPNYRGNTGWGQEFARLEYRRSGRRRVRGHPRRHRPLRRRGLRRSATASASPASAMAAT